MSTTIIRRPNRVTWGPMVPTGTRLYMALPMHNLAGLTPRMGALDPLTAGLDVLGTTFGAIFGNKQKSAELKAQQSIAQAQIDAQSQMAEMQRALGTAQISGAVATARIQAENELAATNAAYSAQLSSQRAQKQVAEDALSAQLLSQSQSGMYGLAQSGMEQAGSLSRTYPRTAATTLIALVLVTAIGVSVMKRGYPSRRKKSKKGHFRGPGVSANWDRKDGSALSDGMNLESSAA